MTQNISIIGAGVCGLWCGLYFALKGKSVTLHERQSEDLSECCSYKAGGMLAPYCEGENADPIITDLGIESMALWKQYFPSEVSQNGSLLLASPKDIKQLTYFEKATTNYKILSASDILSLEKDLEGRFEKALFYPNEGHLTPRLMLRSLIDKIKSLGGKIIFNHTFKVSSKEDIIINATGLSAKQDIPLRGVKGEMVIIKSHEVTIKRPVRLLHYRHPLYIVPRPNHHYMIGATTIETNAKNAYMTLRSAGELLTQAYHLHPAFAEAEIIEMNAGFRPAFIDNIPKIIQKDNIFHINGLYRHGWMVAPAMAKKLYDQIYID